MAKAPVNTFEKILAPIQKGEIAPLYVIWGEDRWLCHQVVDALKKQVLAANADAIDRVVYQYQNKTATIDFSALEMAVQTPPFLSPKRLIIVHNSALFGSGVSDVAKHKLIELIARIPDFSCLVFLEDKFDKRQKKLVQAIEAKGKLCACDHLPAAFWLKRLTTIFKQEGISITQPALESLIARCQGDGYAIQAETEKWIHYALGMGYTKLDESAIETVARPDLNGKIYQLIQAISTGQADEAISLLNSLYCQREPALKILIAIANHLKQLMVAKTTQSVDVLTKRMGVFDFVAPRLIRQSQAFSLDALNRLHQSCFALDVAIKSGGITEWQALEELVFACLETVHNKSD